MEYELLAEHWQDRIALVWTAGDVLDLADELQVELSEEDARCVLAEALHRHDAGVGLNWTVLEEHVRRHIAEADHR